MSQFEIDTTLLRPYHPVLSTPTAEELQNPYSEVFSAIIGGETIYLGDNEEWPSCPACGSDVIPFIHLNLSSPATPSQLISYLNLDQSKYAHALQFLGCSNDDCFQTEAGQDGCAWILRMVPLTSGQSTDPAIVERRAEAHARLSSENLFFPPRLIKEWELGKPEMISYEDIVSLDVTDDFYHEHEPSEGLKLLGFPVKGKFKCGRWGFGCPKGDGCLNWRNLVQLGSGNSCDDQGLELMQTVGNCWIMQCEKHPEVLEFGMSGTW